MFFNQKRRRDLKAAVRLILQKDAQVMLVTGEVGPDPFTLHNRFDAFLDNLGEAQGLPGEVRVAAQAALSYVAIPAWDADLRQFPALFWVAQAIFTALGLIDEGNKKHVRIFAEEWSEAQPFYDRLIAVALKKQADGEELVQKIEEN